ncbi:CBS domain-containing protein CBSCBSPB1-like [Hibiscus syriacus]|uniref:CBS domain-containing protein CBSCBSPB1-like n=1 Tax=Hibiscus syriacus TaxID=106335 RepID=UPI001921717F|nr:CBS domain-containing protein CBSCBSPB1-like [Hibiscus syriacus]
MERAAEKGKAIVAAVEGQSTFIETLRERMFRPLLSTIITDNPTLVTVSPDDTVLATAKKMLESQFNSAVVTVDKKPRGIIVKSRTFEGYIDAGNSAKSASGDYYRTDSKFCLDPFYVPMSAVFYSHDLVNVQQLTPIVDALHTMHDGKFLHLPMMESAAAVATISQVSIVPRLVGIASGINNETSTTMMQRFWDSALALPPNEVDDDAQRYAKYDRSKTAILHRLEDDIDRNRVPQILYEDEDHDKVVLTSDSDLAAAVEHAKLVGWKDLLITRSVGIPNNQILCPLYRLEGEVELGFKVAFRLFRKTKPSKGFGFRNLDYAQSEAWTAAYSAVAAGAAVVAGLGTLDSKLRSSPTVLPLKILTLVEG